MGGMKHRSEPGRDYRLVVDEGTTKAKFYPTTEEIERFVEEAGSDDLPTFGGKFAGGIHVQQVPDEIAPCIRAILESGEVVTSYFELGVAAGGTAFLMHHFFRPAIVVLLDNDQHHKCSLRPVVLADVPHEEVIGDSGDISVAKRVADLGYTYDAMMIDGVHHYENVRRDVEMYAPLLRVGGFLMLHDSALANWGVPRVVAELKANPAWEFVGEWASKTTTPCGVALFQRIA